MQEQLPSSINHFQHALNSYKAHHNGIFKNALSLPFLKGLLTVPI